MPAKLGSQDRAGGSINGSDYDKSRPNCVHGKGPEHVQDPRLFDYTYAHAQVKPVRTRYLCNELHLSPASGCLDGLVNGRNANCAFEESNSSTKNYTERYQLWIRSWRIEYFGNYSVINHEV